MHNQPTAADYANSNAQDAQDRIRKLEARVALLEKDVMGLLAELAKRTTGKEPTR